MIKLTLHWTGLLEPNSGFLKVIGVVWMNNICLHTFQINYVLQMLISYSSTEVLSYPQTTANYPTVKGQHSYLPSSEKKPIGVLTIEFLRPNKKIPVVPVTGLKNRIGREVNCKIILFRNVSLSTQALYNWTLTCGMIECFRVFKCF